MNVSAGLALPSCYGENPLRAPSLSFLMQGPFSLLHAEPHAMLIPLSWNDMKKRNHPHGAFMGNSLDCGLESTDGLCIPAEQTS